jgi:hypothetical protein
MENLLALEELEERRALRIAVELGLRQREQREAIEIRSEIVKHEQKSWL